MTQSGQVLLEAGDGVSADVKNPSVFSVGTDYMVDLFINGAEGEICAVANKDYITEFSNLSTFGQFFLTKLCRTIASIDCIEYDMSGYTSRTEAENMLIIKKDIRLLGFGLLKLKKYQDLIEGT